MNNQSKEEHFRQGVITCETRQKGSKNTVVHHKLWAQNKNSALEDDF